MASIFQHKATNQTIYEGTSWKDENSILHPPNWEVWSAEKKTAMGITEIVRESPPDRRLYTFTYNADGTINKTPKDLAGVKSQLKKIANTEQHSLLGQTDWYFTRKDDKGTAIPSNVQTWRDAIRTKGDAMESAIDGAANIDAVEALFVVYESDGKTVKSGVLYDWPELVE